MHDFKYYCGVFEVSKKEKVKKDYHGKIPRRVIEESRFSDYSSMYFKSGVLSVDMPAEYSRYSNRFMFPPLDKVELNTDLSAKIQMIKELYFENKLKEKKLMQLQDEKRSIFNELKRTSMELNNIKRDQ